MATSSSRPKTPIDYVGFFNSTGYGQSAVSNVLALDQSGLYDLRIQSLHGRPGSECFSSSDHQRLVRMASRTENPRAVQVLHCIPSMTQRVGLLPRRISFATFETFQPPQEWANLLNRHDAVICPSLFNKEQFARLGVSKPIFVIPHVLNTSIWNDAIEPMPKQEGFTFLFVGTWRRRKGFAVLLEAWMREFGPDENVRLLVKTDKTDQAMQDVHKFKQEIGKKEIAPISFERRVFSEQQMASFVKSADCYVSATMGEGFGLPGLQAMALKVPVIITNFSGCQEYAREDNCTLLQPSGFLVHESIDPIPQFAFKKWPRIKVTTVQEAMRGVFQNYKQAQVKADRAYEFAQQNFNYGVFVSKFGEMMETVYSGSHSQTKAIKRHS